MIVNDISELIGDTPLLRADRLATSLQIPSGCRLWLKLESQNPGRSVKDRTATALLTWLTGQGSGNCTGLASTSGNTGIGLALAGRMCENRIVQYIDSAIAPAKREHLRLLGAETQFMQLDLQEVALQQGVQKRIDAVQETCRAHPKCLELDQYGNAACPEWHRRFTAREIFEELPDTKLVCVSVGTGATVSGIAEYIHKERIDCFVAGVEPQGSVVFGGDAEPYSQRGPGNPFVPANLWTHLISGLYKVDDSEAARWISLVAKTEGVIVGDSTGAAIGGVRRALAEKKLASGDIVVLVSDCGIKYADKPLARIVELQNRI